MAIQWLDNLVSIKKVLSEAETSARLKAIHSLELHLSQDALDILKEALPNATSLEKFFIEKAIKTLEGYLESGEIPERISKAKEKAYRLAQTLSEDEDYQEDEEKQGVVLTDLEDSLRTSSEPIAPEEPLSEYSEMDAVVVGQVQKAESSGPKPPALEEPKFPETVLSEEPQMEPQEEVVSEAEDYLPPLSTGEAGEDYPELLPPMDETGDDYDDLLPPLRLPDEEAGYEDLLPSVKEASTDAGDYDSDYEGLLPPLERGEPASSFDDLLPPMGEGESENPVQDDYDDLLPPLQTGNSQEVSVDDLPTNDPGLALNYDELLPPLKDGPEDVNNLGLPSLDSESSYPDSGKSE